MTRSLYTILLLLFFAASVIAQKTVKLPNGQVIELIEKEIICYSSDHEFHGYNPAPSLKAYGAKGNSNPANFQVTYRSFPSAHQAAIDHALFILSGLINSPINIHVNAEFTSIEEEGALAGAIFNITFYNPASPNSSLVNNQFNFNNTTDYNSFFPISLIEKLSGFELTNGSIPDINITVNSEANWFTDFQNPTTIQTGQFDLVTIILHEVMHGLGFAGFSGINSSDVPSNRVGSLTNGTPLAFVFDRFIENSSGTKLQDLEDGSNALSSYMQSNDLFFNSPSLDTPAKLFAPSTFSPGSSLYHLDQNTFQNTDERLMTPFYSTPDINLDPALGMELLYDMGWDYTEIDHIPLGFLENFNQSYIAKVQVTSDSGIDSASLELIYSQDTFKTTLSVPLIYNMSTQEFEATIPAPGAEAAYQYYFQVMDKRGVTRSTPANFGEQFAFFRLTYGIDNTEPVIDHQPITQLTTLDKNLLITSGGSDFFAGIDNMFLQATLNGSALPEVILNEVVDGFGSFQYDGSIDFGRNLISSDVVTYKLRAVDKSQAANEAFFPADGSFLTVPVIESPAVQIAYETSFDDNSVTDFSLNGFGIELPNNFLDSCLANILHPYPAAGNNNTLNLTAELRVPIEINASDPSIIFDEIVLVEPGEPNSTFGETEFWDYVIVEGRKLGSTNWIPFAEGYDAKENSSWSSLYNSAVVAGVSSATPFQSTYKEHELDMTSNTNFVAGDTIFVRFRLFSDPGASGWGWAINNLKIQNRNSTVSVDEVEDIELFSVFPNPVSNASEVIIDMSLKERKDNLQFSIHDTNGQLIKQWQPRLQGLRYNESIDISGLNKGVYFISVRDDQGVSVKKLLIL